LLYRTEERRASRWLERFFDLCFVGVGAALARSLHDSPTLGGVLYFVGLFTPVWWDWMGYLRSGRCWDRTSDLCCVKAV
jgi:low temperature requirement protein LtrA